VRGIAALEFAGGACCKRDTISVSLIAVNGFFRVFLRKYVPALRADKYHQIAILTLFYSKIYLI
jgi:hypothetical protein